MHGSATKAARAAGQRAMAARNARIRLEREWDGWQERIASRPGAASLGDVLRRMIDAQVRAVRRSESPPRA